MDMVASVIAFVSGFVAAVSAAALFAAFGTESYRARWIALCTLLLSLALVILSEMAVPLGAVKGAVTAFWVGFALIAVADLTNKGR